MPDIVCPGCSRITRLVAVRRAADEFCAHCDFPLFWAPTAVTVGAAIEGSDTALRRLPGAGGRQRLGNKVCPDCGELNPIDATNCLRCDADLNPRIEPPAPPPPPPPPPPEPEPVEVSMPPWWPWSVGVGLATVIAIVVLAVT